MDVEAEIRDLKRRVNELEGSFVFLTSQIKAVHTDLLEFQKVALAEFQSLREFQKAALQEFKSIRGDLQELKPLRGELQSLRHDLPDLIASGVGEALRKR